MKQMKSGDGGDGMEAEKAILNRILVHLFNDILKVEEKSLSTGAFKDLTMTDMHTIEAIGHSQERNMSAIAKALSITVGTLTIAINHLVKKGYVNRTRSLKDKRIVLVSLTEKGEAAFNHHLEFHNRMVDEIVQKLDKQELEVLAQALEKVDHYFTTYKQKEKSVTK